MGVARPIHIEVMQGRVISGYLRIIIGDGHFEYHSMIADIPAVHFITFLDFDIKIAVSIRAVFFKITVYRSISYSVVIRGYPEHN